MPNCGVEKELCSIKGMRGNNIKDTLLHLVVFPGAQPRGPLIASRRISGPCKFGYEDFKPSVIASFSAEESKQMSNGLMDSVDAAALLAHEEVVRIPN
jgi:hypothetical protein